MAVFNDEYVQTGDIVEISKDVSNYLENLYNKCLQNSIESEDFFFIVCSNASDVVWHEKAQKRMQILHKKYQDVHKK